MLALRLGFLTIGWLDVVDIGLVALLLYQVYRLVRGSVASRVFVGYLLVYSVYLLVKALGLSLLTTILEYFISVGALALIIIFQQEIRRFLGLLGRSTSLRSNLWVRRWLLRQPSVVEPITPLRPILDACKALSAEFTGGLITIQKNDDLTKVAQSGEEVDARLSKTLLLALFSQYSPLHDGSILICDGRIRAARCILPVSDDDELPHTLGFRHRAALGMSAATDAAVIAVSEQSGHISLALNGELFNNIPLSDLETRLQRHLTAPGRRGH